MLYKRPGRGQKPKSFAELVDRSATEKMYALALRFTNKYEKQTRGRKREQSLFDEIEAFVWNEVENR